MNGQQIRVLTLSGSHYAMGQQHGEAYKSAIRDFTLDRVHLCGDSKWSGRALSADEVLAVAEACLDEHQRYSPALTDELRGLADATGLSLAELIVVGGFTDFIDTLYGVAQPQPQAPAHSGFDNCTAFLIPNSHAAGGQGFFGQTWDMHDSATPHVVMLAGRPEGKPAFMAFTTVGCVGMIGMNDRGVAVGINNLMCTDGQVGVTWPFVVRKALEQDSAEAALECVTSARLAGAHNYLIMDQTGRGYNAEATPSACHVTQLDNAPLIHTNHCLAPQTVRVERERDAEAKASSERRLRRAEALLDRSPLTEADLEALTRDPVAICVTAKPPRFVETCGAAIMRPATGDLWAVWGLPSENDYEHFNVKGG
jgi:isopenicillin-N N-acyltransferase-like protein